MELIRQQLWEFTTLHSCRLHNLINPVLAVVITAFGIGVKYKEYDGLRGAELRAAKAKKKAELAAAKKEAK